MKFVCGNCGETIREAHSSKNHKSWQAHEACAHETLFADHLVGRDKGEPKALRVREAGELGDGLEPKAHGERRELKRTGGVIDRIADQTHQVLREVADTDQSESGKKAPRRAVRSREKCRRSEDAPRPVTSERRRTAC